MQKLISPLFATALLLACGQGASTVSGTASIEGTVSAAQALTVSVEGSNQTALTDTTGAFVLVGVPAGTRALHFSGGSDDATVEIAPLVDSEHRSMSVSVSGRSGRLDDSRNGSAFRGVVKAVTPPSLTVGDRTVITDASTSIERQDAHIALADVKVGEQAEVEGALQADGSVLATRIHVGEDAEHAPDLTAFIGALNKIDGVHLTVGILPVVLSAQTGIFRGDAQVDATALAVGQQLLVVGIVDAAQGVLAARVRILVPDDGSHDAHFQGTLKAIAEHSVTVNDHVIPIDAATTVDGAGDPKTLADLHIGDLVDVEITAAGVAKEIKRISATPPPPPTEIELTGTIENRGQDGLTVSGHRFAVDAHTQITAGGVAVALSALNVGDVVEVKATPRSGLPPLATRVSREH